MQLNKQGKCANVTSEQKSLEQFLLFFWKEFRFLAGLQSSKFQSFFFSCNKTVAEKNCL